MARWAPGNPPGTPPLPQQLRQKRDVHVADADGQRNVGAVQLLRS